MKLCSCCFEDEEIRQYIVTESTEKGFCEYCSSYSSLLEVGELLDFFKQFIEIFQPNDRGKDLISLIQKDWDLFTDNTVGRDILSDILLAIRSDITDVKTSVLYNDDINECVAFWQELKSDIQNNRRYINNIERLEELGWDSLFPEPVIFKADKTFYRARIHTEDTQDKFDISLMGPPPPTQSIAGRANPLGIPYLYLSNELETTLYEARALYLDRLSIGKFHVKTDMELRMIDVTGEQNSYRSPLLSDDIATLTKSKLLMRVIGSDLSKPMRRYDSELEYIATQFICEYIRYIYGADGIMFKSSLYKEGVNYVVFNHDKLECTDVEQHTVIEVSIKSEPTFIY